MEWLSSSCSVDIYNIYVESFKGTERLQTIVKEAPEIVSAKIWRDYAICSLVGIGQDRA